jgi:hypothetical protein
MRQSSRNGAEPGSGCHQTFTSSPDSPASRADRTSDDEQNYAEDDVPLSEPHHANNGNDDGDNGQQNDHRFSFG